MQENELNNKDYFDKCILKLKELTGKKYIFITKRGNDSIKKVLKYAQNNFDEIYYPDQGGWITYKQYSEKFNFKINIIETNLSLIPDNLIFNSNSIVIYNSMPAYAFLTNLSENNFKNSNNLIINDATGSLGTIYGKQGDFILGSFGRWKPINLGVGGFIATNLEDFNVDHVMDLDFQKLLFKLNDLSNRLKFIKKIRDKVLKDLLNFEVIYPNLEGLNVIVKFNNLEEKEKLINYCLENSLEYTLCPKDIRVNIDAISIEIKRLEE
jgi:hypothetical protein